MVSFDVISLFTKIPIDIAKSVIFNLLHNDKCLKERTNLTIEELVEELNLCLDNTCIQFCENCYKQIFGVPIGSPISVTIAYLVMKNVENRALQTFPNPLTLWKRYVDDTFVIIKKDVLNAFHEHINNIE